MAAIISPHQNRNGPGDACLERRRLFAAANYRYGQYTRLGAPAPYAWGAGAFSSSSPSAITTGGCLTSLMAGSASNRSQVRSPYWTAGAVSVPGRLRVAFEPLRVDRPIGRPHGTAPSDGTSPLGKVAWHLMGTLFYGASRLAIEVDDVLLAHVQVVIVAKLRRDEPLLLTWNDSVTIGDGRSAVWVSMSTELHWKFDGDLPARLDRGRLESLAVGANSSAGLHLEHDATLDAPASHQPGAQQHPAESVAV